MTRKLPEGYGPIPAAEPLALKSNLVLCPNAPVAQIMAEYDGGEHGRCIEPVNGWRALPIGTLLYAPRWVPVTEALPPEHVTCAVERKPIPTALSDHDRASLRSERAKIVDAPLCEQMQALQMRAAKLRPIDLQDAELDAADPHTSLFLLAEYWQRKATKAREELRNIAEAKRFDRERFDNDTSFADWAQSRARHALGA